MKSFDEVFEDKTKYGTKIKTDEYQEEGAHFIIDQGQEQVASYTNLEKGIFKDVPAIVFGDHTRVIKYIDKPFFLGADGVKVLKCRLPNANYKYLYYALRYAKIPNTGYNRHFKWLKEIKIAYPDDNKQAAIVEILDKVSTIIEIQKQKLQKLDELVKSRFVEMFTDKGFPKTTIGSLVANKVPTAKKSFAPSDTIKYIDISSIDNKRNIMTGYTEYVLEDAPSRAQQHIQKNDIVVSTVRPNLKNVAITGYNDKNLVASSGFCVLRVEKCLPSYLMAIVCSDDFTDAMTKVVTGANYPAIKDSDVKNYVIPLPPIDLQNEFAKFVEETDKLKFAAQQALDKAQLLFDSLMQKYFG